MEDTMTDSPAVPAFNSPADSPATLPAIATTATIVPASPVDIAQPMLISQRCAAGLAVKQACSFKWRPALMQSIRFLAIQHALNTPTYNGTLQGSFFHDYAASVRQYRFSRWSDDDPFIVDYVGHPMMGAVTGRIQIQNDPRGMTLAFGKSRPYWISRAKAMAFSTVYAAQWELGPISETSIGNLGSFQYYSKTAHKLTNGTGMVDLVMTPVGGTAFLIAEDVLDKYVITRLEGVSQRKAWLLAISVLNPTRSVANVLRMRMPWYRDGRRSSGPSRP